MQTNFFAFTRFGWFKCLEDGREDVEDDAHLVSPSFLRTNGSIENVRTNIFNRILKMKLLTKIIIRIVDGEVFGSSSIYCCLVHSAFTFERFLVKYSIVRPFIIYAKSSNVRILAFT